MNDIWVDKGDDGWTGVEGVSQVPFVGQQVVVPGAALIRPSSVVVPGGLGQVLLGVLLEVCEAH